jgi:ankyrin repeat protein
MASALGDVNLVQRHLDRDPRSIEMTVSAEDFPMKNPHAGGTIYIWTLGGNKGAHAVAREFGREDVFRLLIERSPHDLAVAAACEVGDEPLLQTLIAKQSIDASSLSPKLARKLVDAADRNVTAAVALMLAAGWPVGATGKHGATALHFAAWHGNRSMAATLLGSGAPLEVRDHDFHATALGWALHGSLHGSNADKGDYAGVVEALLDSGASPDHQWNASAAVLAVLRRRTGANDR